MPPAPTRPDPVDLLLCGHHYRVSAAAVAAAGAVVVDEEGAVVQASSGHVTPLADRAGIMPRR